MQTARGARLEASPPPLEIPHEEKGEAGEEISNRLQEKEEAEEVTKKIALVNYW